jgi:hypothetical protein
MGKRPKLKVTGKKKPKTTQKESPQKDSPEKTSPQKGTQREELPVFLARRRSNMPPFKDEHILVREASYPWSCYFHQQQVH